MGHYSLRIGFAVLAFILPEPPVYAGNSGDVLLQNPGFENSDDTADLSGWQLMESGHTIVRDRELAIEGTASVRIAAGASPRGSMLRQQLPSRLVIDGPLRLRAYVRTENVTGSAVLFVTVDGEQGRLFRDDMRDRPVRGTTGWKAYTIDVPRLRNARRLTVGALLLGPGKAWFDGFALRRVERDHAIAKRVREYLEEALSIMQSRYVDRDMVNWDRLRERMFAAAAGAQTPADAYPALEVALRQLDERHAGLVRPRRTPGAKTPKVDGAAARTKAGNIEAFAVEGDLGYIRVPGFQPASAQAATAFADAGQAGLEQVAEQGVCGWIVDLRENTGGSMWPMLAALGPFWPEDTVLGMHISAEERARWWYRNGKTGTLTAKRRRVRASASHVYRFAGHARPPVAVLLSGTTASAGEAVAIALAGRSNTRTFGQTTAGLLTANATVPLPDGALLVFPVGRTANREGQIQAGPVKPDVAAEESTVRETAVAWLHAQPVCRD